jgi:hypothetical protein
MSLHPRSTHPGMLRATRLAAAFPYATMGIEDRP